MRTQHLRALPLDDDLIDHILALLPSFTDLQSVILSSNLFYRVFNTRPSSIVGAVARNEIGPALPEALRACRYKALDPWPEDMGDLPPITPIEARSLSRNAAAVKGLEAVFSSRYKDRSSKTSKLSFMESWRFHRAMHTLSLFTTVFPGNDLYHERDISNIQRKQAERTAFLTQFPSNKLLEIYSASRFLIKLLRWSVIARQGTGLWDKHAYSAWAASFGPSLIWRIYSEADAIKDIGPEMEEASDNTLDSYIFPSILTTLQQRGDDFPLADFHWVSILDENYTRKDKCQMCYAVCGRDRWNETNWDNLEGVSSVKLSWSRILFEAIRAQGLSHLLDGHLLKLTFSTLFHEMYQTIPSHADVWKKEDWLCLNCIHRIFEAQLAPWLLMRKKLAGQTIQPDCRDGYNCEIQGIDNHGEKFNVREPPLQYYCLTWDALQHLCNPLPKEV